MYRMSVAVQMDNLHIRVGVVQRYPVDAFHIDVIDKFEIDCSTFFKYCRHILDMP